MCKELTTSELLALEYKVSKQRFDTENSVYLRLFNVKAHNLPLPNIQEAFVRLEILKLYLKPFSDETYLLE